ncbi:MAG: DUF5522 domain-containing protein [Edaphocola sp.]
MNVVEGVDFYFNDEGKMVLTAHFLSKRGYCCGNGCLHCPYGFQNVPEPKKSKLLQARAKDRTHR